MKNWRLRTRLILAYAGLILVGFVALALVAGRQITRGAAEDFEQNLETQAALVARGLEDLVEDYLEGDISREAVQTAVNDFAAQLQARVTLVKPSGEAWLDSQGAPPGGNLRADLEIAAALAEERTRAVRPDENGTAVIYTAAPIIEDDDILSVVRLAVPESATLSAIRRRQLVLAAGVLVMTLLAWGAALWLSASLTRPLEELRLSALRHAQGDFSPGPTPNRQDEVGQLAQALNHMAAQVAAMLAEQKAFASNASHELRAPLTAIRLRSEALREGSLDDETTHQYITEIDDEAVRLSHLVNDLILLSRFDSGRAEWGQEQIDPARLAHTVCQSLQAMAQQKQIAVHLDIPAALPPVQASQSHLYTVFHNLLENALKYTPPHGQVVWRLAAVNDQLHSILQDTGQGIAPEDLPHLFERFYRGDKAHTRATGGVGLGLSLTHSIVTFYHGRLTITSPGLNQGTTVQLWWPLRQEQGMRDG